MRKLFPRFSTFLIALPVALSALAQGAVAELPFLLMAVIIALLAIVQFEKVTSVTEDIVPRAVIITMGAVLAVAYAQVLIVNPIQINTSLQEILSTKESVSVSPGATLAAIPRVIAPMLLFLLSYGAASTKEEALNLLCLSMYSGGAILCLGLLQYTVDPQHIVTAPKVHYASSFTGTFINPNNAAAYAALVLQAGLAFILLPSRGLPRAIRTWRMLPWVVVALATLALFLTKSRAGIACGLLSSGMLIIIARRQLLESNMSRYWTQLVLVMLGLALVVALLGQGFLTRLTNETLLGQRACTFRSLVDAILDHANIYNGTGLGAFRASFPMYRTSDCGINGIWDRAHNFYLEGILGIGLTFVALLLALLVILFRRLARGLSQSAMTRPIAALGISATTGLMLHSMVDFPLQIPGINMLYAMLLGVSARIALVKNQQDVN